MKTKLVAAGKKPFIFGSRRLNAGDEFEASGPNARLLKALGRAVDAPVPVVATKQPPAPKTPSAANSVPSEDIQPQRRVYRRRDVAEETPAAATDEPENEEARPRRQYRRRDLTAEE